MSGPYEPNQPADLNQPPPDPQPLRLASHKLSIRTKFVKRFEAEVAS